MVAIIIPSAKLMPRWILPDKFDGKSTQMRQSKVLDTRDHGEFAQES